MEKSASSDKSSKKENECSRSETDVPNIEDADISTDMPNIEGAGISSDSNSNSCKVDLTIISDSRLQNTAKILAVSDHNKDESEMREISDSDVNTGIHHTMVSEATALSTGSTAEAIPLLIMNSTALECDDDGSMFPRAVELLSVLSE
jgi:hypothetical protein